MERKIVSLLPVHGHAHRFASASYYTAADLYSMLYETAKALSCNYGNVLLFYRFDQLAWRCIRLQWSIRLQYNEDYKFGSSSGSAHPKQGGCRVRQQWDLGVRFWVYGQHLSSGQKIKMMQCALSYCVKAKNFNRLFSFCQPWDLPWQNRVKFSGGMFWLCTDEIFRRTVHQ